MTAVRRSLSVTMTRVVDVLMPWKKLRLELANRSVELERLTGYLKRVREQREKLRRELEAVSTQRDSTTAELEQTRSVNRILTNRLKRADVEREKLNQDLNRIRDQMGRLRRGIEFLDFVVKARGIEEFYAALTEAKTLLLSPAVNFNTSPSRTLKIEWIRQDQDSWLGRNFAIDGIELSHEPLDRLIEYIAHVTNGEGAFPLWEGYGETVQNTEPLVRMPNQVRIGSEIGSFFTWLACQRNPNLIVEIGTAFGVSGMYWTAGLELSGRGRLVTFEPNAVWRSIAVRNISLVSSRFKSICGAVEQCAEASFETDENIDVLFIDAIHTDAVVTSQLKLLRPRLSPGALVLIDDINFSDDMKRCWQRLSVAEDVRASVEIKGRIGILEY